MSSRPRRVRRRRRCARGTRVESRTAGCARVAQARSRGRPAARHTRLQPLPGVRCDTDRDGAPATSRRIVPPRDRSSEQMSAGSARPRAAPGLSSTPSSRSTRTDRPSFRRASGSPSMKRRPGARTCTSPPAAVTDSDCDVTARRGPPERRHDRQRDVCGQLVSGESRRYR